MLHQQSLISSGRGLRGSGIPLLHSCQLPAQGFDIAPFLPIDPSPTCSMDVTRTLCGRSRSAGAIPAAASPMELAGFFSFQKRLTNNCIGTSGYPGAIDLSAADEDGLLNLQAASQLERNLGWSRRTA